MGSALFRLVPPCTIMSLAHFNHNPELAHLQIELAVARFDAAAAPAFRELLAANWPEQELQGVTVDLRAVSFIDSSGIGSLIAVSKKLGRQGEPVELCHVQPQVRSVIELLRLQSLFRVQ